MGGRGAGGWCLKRESAMAHEIESTVKKGRVLIRFFVYFVFGSCFQYLRNFSCNIYVKKHFDL